MEIILNIFLNFILLHEIEKFNYNLYNNLFTKVYICLINIFFMFILFIFLIGHSI